MSRVEAVVTHHLDGFRSGVARFNALLAQRLGVPLLRLGDAQIERIPHSLVSFKTSELGAGERESVSRLLAAGWRGELFLHEFSDDELELALVHRASCVHCGNLEIHAHVALLTPHARQAFVPSLVTDERPFPKTDISVFSLGMAHKIQLDAFKRLRELLDGSGASYAVYVSAANHETTSLQDAGSVLSEMEAVFPASLYFLGNLSDVAVSNWMRQATFFAAFFRGGVRANNTSVAFAMERGAVVLTNLDRYSPPEYVHMTNVIDVARCDRLPLDAPTLRALGRDAARTAAAHGWETLLAELTAEGPAYAEVSS